MDKQKLNAQTKSSKEGYIIVPNYFLKKWVRVLGLCQQMGIAKTTLLRYQNTLIKFGLIKNITRGKSTTGHYKNNIYQITSLEELSRHPDPGKIIDFLGSKMKPDRYQNDTYVGSNLILSLVSNCYPNNNNINNTNTTTTKEEKDAVVAVDFKKLKEKGEEKMLVMKERLRDLNFEESLTEKILKDYPSKKIEEKLDLLTEKRNIRSPAGWLMAALKDDYQDVEEERDEEEPVGQASRLSQDNQKILSPEEAIRRFRLLRHQLMTNGRTGVSPIYENVGVRFIEPVFSGRMNPPPTKTVKQKLTYERKFKCPN